MSILLRTIVANLQAKHPRHAQKAEVEATDLVELLNSLYAKVKKAAKPEDLDHLFRLVKGLDLADAVDFDCTLGEEKEDSESTNLDELGDDDEDSENPFAEKAKPEFSDHEFHNEPDEDDLSLDED